MRYYVKPMNCPIHHKIFGSRPRSYRDLPLRLAEYGTCYRYEKSGELFGLLRVRSMQMNDAHIYCAEEQFEQEFMAVVGLYLAYFKLFGIEKYVMRFSTHHQKGLGKKYVDNERLWLKTEDMVRRAMSNGNVPFVEVADEAAFYGPKIDVQIWSAIGKRVHPGDEPGRLCPARPLRPDLHEPGGRGGDAAVHPPCAAEHARAADRLPDRALRRQLPGLAGAGTGARHPDHRRGTTSTRPASPNGWLARACAPGRT